MSSSKNVRSQGTTNVSAVRNRERGRRLTELRRSNAAGVHAKGRDRRNERREAIVRSQEEG